MHLEKLILHDKINIKRMDVVDVMLYKRATELLLLLIKNNGYTSVKELSTYFNISEKTIRNDLDNIDDYLLKNGLQKLTRKPNLGIKFSGTDYEIDMLISNISSKDIDNYIYTSEERQTIILLSIATHDSSKLKIKDFEDILKVSRSTINSDMKQLKNKLADNNIKLEYSITSGYSILGEESNIRNCISDIIIESIKNEYRDVGNNLEYKKLSDFINIDDIKTIENVFYDMEELFNVDYSDIAFSSQIIRIYVSLRRIVKNHVLDFEDFKDSIKLTQEYVMSNYLAERLEEKYNITINENERIYFTICLLGSNLVQRKEKDYSDLIMIQLITRKLIENVSLKVSIDLNDDLLLFKYLLEHLKPMIYRVKYNIELKNPILDEIINDYKDLFISVKDSLMEIQDFENMTVSDDEISYLTIHFGAAIERKKLKNKSKPKVLIVCNTGYGTSQWLAMQIESMFNVDIVAATNSRRIDRILSNNHVDVIISTVNIKPVKNIKTIYVRPILTERNIKELNYEFSHLRNNMVEVDKILEIVSKYCIINDKNGLTRDLENIFVKQFDFTEGVEQKMLKDVLKEETLELNVETKDWVDAVKFGGNLLYKDNCVTEEYIQAMIDNVKEIGPYIVVTKGVAMPHAQPDKGALKVGVSLITLKKPVNFGNKENDPVNIVICFSATDSKTHLKALSQLAKLLDNDEALQKISSSTSKAEALEIIKEYS